MSVAGWNIWLIIVIVGAGTFVLRYSFIGLSDRLQEPAWLGRALRYVPPAVMAALASSAILVRDGQVDVSLGNHRMLAGIVALLVAWKTRSLLWTILGGLACLWLLAAL